MAERRPNRVTGGAHDQFWDYCDDEELRIQRCDECGHMSWPPVDSCEKCGQRRFTWKLMSGDGSLVSWCTFERQYYVELGIPWDTILVELDEGPLFISDPSGFGNDDAELGMRVRVAFIECEDDAGAFRLPVFERS